MITNSVDERYKYYYKYSKTKKCMDHDDNILSYTMSKSIFKTNTNTILTSLMKSIDTSIKFLFKYVDRLKDFKNYLKYNR